MSAAASANEIKGAIQASTTAPQISNGDLFSFFQSHFSSDSMAQFGQDFLKLREAPVSHDEGLEQMVEDDDLGYYPDGVKRTLTDEQIAIFRHSELRKLQRQSESGVLSNKNAQSQTLDKTTSTPLTGPGSSTGATVPPVSQSNIKKKKTGNRSRPEPKPDLRKRTWDVVETGLDSLDYD